MLIVRQKSFQLCIPLKNSTTRITILCTCKAQKNHIQLVTSDGSEFLFQGANRESLEEWQQKLNFNSNLDPTESEKKSSLVGMGGIPSDPRRPSDLPLEVGVWEPMYTNIVADSHNSDIENQPENNGSQENDDDRKLIENSNLISVELSKLVD